MARPDAAKLFSAGVVLEQDLHDVVTHSVGQSFIGEHVFSYCGEQYLTQDGQGEEVYGGSNLLVVPGYYEDLLQLALPDDVRQAIEQARVFDNAADEAYPGFYASRRNYDIARAWTVTASAVAACSNSPGAWAGPAARKSRRCRVSSTTRASRPSACPRWKPTWIKRCRRMPLRCTEARPKTATFFSSM